MLAKVFRLPPRISFKGFDTYKSEAFLIRVRRNELPNSRFGVVISKKIDKRATARNRMRRLYVSVIEEHLQHRVKGYDMLFILKNPSESREVIERNILEATKHIH